MPGTVIHYGTTCVLCHVRCCAATILLLCCYQAARAYWAVYGTELWYGGTRVGTELWYGQTMAGTERWYVPGLVLSVVCEAPGLVVAQLEAEQKALADTQSVRRWLATPCPVLIQHIGAICYAIPAIGIANGASSLDARYAMPGTDLAYGGRELEAMREEKDKVPYPIVLRCPVLGCAITLRARYAMFCTGTYYYAASSVRDVRYWCML
eukprot:1190173-Rhodomonas_salina.5